LNRLWEKNPSCISKCYRMTLQKETVFILPIFDKWILHAPLHGVTARVNEPFLIGLKENWIPKQAAGLSDLSELLSKEPSHVPEICKGVVDPVFLGIIPTRACNLSCKYCDFGALNSESVIMDHRLAIKAVDWMATHIKKRGKKKIKKQFF